MKVIFRVDSSSNIGIGHLARCLKLAKVLKDHDIHFVSKDLNGNGNFLLKKKYKLHNIHSKNEKNDAVNFIKILKSKININKDKDYVVLDSYDLKQNWEKKVKPHTKKLITIDDRFRESNSDFYLNSNWFFEKNAKFLQFKNSGLLLGPIYGLINKVKKKNKKKFITIYFGSNDKFNLTTQTLKNLLKFKEKNIIIILGHNFSFISDIKKLIKGKKYIKIVDKFQDLGEIFSKTKYFIGAGGSTSTERFLYKIPSLICPVVKNQKLISQFLYDKKFQHILKKKNFFNYKKWKKAYIFLKKQNKIFIKNLNYLSSDDSILRVKNIFNYSNQLFKLIKFDRRFKYVIYNFVNQPDAIDSRLTNRYISIKDHEKFVSKIEKSSKENLYLGLNRGIISGFIRFSIKQKGLAYIDIFCCPTVRGNYFAKNMLFHGMKDILRTNKKINFIAEVKKKI